jgi:hypothetical protein
MSRRGKDSARIEDIKIANITTFPGSLHDPTFPHSGDMLFIPISVSN